MKRTLPILLTILTASASAFAQAPSDPVQKALMAAPTRMKKEEVTVIKWKPDFTYDTLQKGTSTLVCYDLSGFPTHPAFMLECTSTANLPNSVSMVRILDTTVSIRHKNITAAPHRLHMTTRGGGTR